MMALRVAVAAAVFTGLPQALMGQSAGPGQGPWVTSTPEEEGLSTAALDAVAEQINQDVGGRKCFITIKNGHIVSEKYFAGAQESTLNTGWSVTKSFCSSLFGIGKQQGWADEMDKITEKIKEQRKCNKEDTLQNVLTMTGLSQDINNLEFFYDWSGFDCYNTISDYIADNNPDGLSAVEFSKRHLFDALGIEHSTWGGIPLISPKLPCGFGADLSCRDLGRVAQLWLNDGQWPGVGQVMSRDYAQDATRWTFPASDPDRLDPYGYGVRLRPDDPVDPAVAYFGGILVNCAFFSREHQAIVISMGAGADLTNCKDQIWEQARAAIVSSSHPRYNATRKYALLERQNKTTATRQSAVLPQEA